MSPRMKRLLAELIAGLSVPRSLGPILGAAIEPLDQLRDYLHLFGYPDADDVEKAIEERLAEDAKVLTALGGE